MDAFLTGVALIGIVITVASLLSGALDRSGVPLVGAFLALGALLGPLGLGLVDVTLESPALRALATLALVLVLFTDAVTLDASEIRSHRSLAWRMMLPGTLLPAALTAVAGWVLLDLDWRVAAILGAALASTDPVILRSLLRSSALSPATRIALRLETGMNDVALLPIVVLGLLLVGVGAGGEVAAAELGRSLLGLFLLGPALGVAVGWVGIAALVRVRSRVGVRRDYESLYALGLALSAFAAAEGVGGSGFVAAFAAGIVVAAQDVELCDCFLEYGEATAEMLMLLTFVAFGATLIWSGLAALDLPTLAVVAVALLGRTVVLYPVLAGLGLSRRERRLIALLGPRGLSTLLLALLPVFAGMPGAERLFAVTSLAVLLSVVLHGSGIALLLRGADRGGSRPAAAGAIEPPPPGPLGITPGGASAPAPVTVAEVRSLAGEGQPVLLLDVRAERSYRTSAWQAAGALRLPPDDPVRAAEALRLPRDATLVLYCA